MFVVKIKGIDYLLNQLAYFLAVPGVYYQFNTLLFSIQKNRGKELHCTSRFNTLSGWLLGHRFYDDNHSFLLRASYGSISFYTLHQSAILVGHSCRNDIHPLQHRVNYNCTPTPILKQLIHGSFMYNQIYPYLVPVSSLKIVHSAFRLVHYF